MASNLNMAAPGRKENWNLGFIDNRECIWRTFDLLLFKILGVIQCTSLNRTVTKWLSVELKGLKFGTKGSCHIYMGTFELLVF